MSKPTGRYWIAQEVDERKTGRGSGIQDAEVVGMHHLMISLDIESAKAAADLLYENGFMNASDVLRYLSDVRASFYDQSARIKAWDVFRNKLGAP